LLSCALLLLSGKLLLLSRALLLHSCKSPQQRCQARPLLQSRVQNPLASELSGPQGCPACL
jgi:hypothetical protein